MRKRVPTPRVIAAAAARRAAIEQRKGRYAERDERARLAGLLYQVLRNTREPPGKDFPEVKRVLRDRTMTLGNLRRLLLSAQQRRASNDAHIGRYENS